MKQLQIFMRTLQLLDFEQANTLYILQTRESTINYALNFESDLRPYGLNSIYLPEQDLLYLI